MPSPDAMSAAPAEAHAAVLPKLDINFPDMFILPVTDGLITYASPNGPIGPCRDAPENPILHSGSAPGLIGPGHPSIFLHAGRNWIAWHGWRPALDAPDRYRALYTAPLNWVDGRPVVELD